MNRIVVVGCGGSGKTYLARRLAERLALPLTHLDTVYYGEDWKPLPADTFAAVQQLLVARPRWIIEGNYAGTMPLRLAAADTVVVMDLPARTCLLGLLQRRRRYGAGQQPALGVYNRINASFIRYVLGYRRTMLPRVQRMIADQLRVTPGRPAEVVILSSRRAARGWLEGLSGGSDDGERVS